MYLLTQETNSCIHPQIYTYHMHSYINVYVNTYISLYLQKRIHIYKHTYINTYINKNKYTYIHSYKHLSFNGCMSSAVSQSRLIICAFSYAILP